MRWPPSKWFCYLAGMIMLYRAVPATSADWFANAEGTLHYTDDAALFSATRRLNLEADPTQPALDSSLLGKGSDMVFEPDLNVMHSLTSSRWGRTEISARAQAFIYTLNSRFNHASFGIEALHELVPGTKVRVRFYSSPDLFLGDNESRQVDSLAEERVTSYIGSVRLEQRLSDDWEVRLLTRYGARLYNDPFAERDTTFWTVGPHLVWHATNRVNFTLGYHFEKGLADGRHQPVLKDDTSYTNHYVAFGLESEITERFGVQLGLHYERNNWLSSIEGDERKGGHETVIVGELNARYKLSERCRLRAGFQRSPRKQSFEEDVVYNTNVSVGVSYQF
ncbi:hypothetical protein [Nitrosospira multiformis]|uniref:hypothetical protein n=1 Tax=Nitrosospira multiformis TaxID=1231 RepID=UPI0008956AD9|nr:hypothetical protein [Nitrosospira multiformis]SEA63018.1 outer membrane insertion C-terminal signal [Nitrosospira multiformis]